MNSDLSGYPPTTTEDFGPDGILLAQLLVATITLVSVAAGGAIAWLIHRAAQ